MRSCAVLLFLAALSVSAAPPKKIGATLAPDAVPHSIALFLDAISKQGAREVTFKARAVGTRFFFQEPGGVTVYVFDEGRYTREVFLRNFTLDRAVKRYAKK